MDIITFLLHIVGLTFVFTYDDLAYRKIATQSQTYPGGYMYYDANNAVDRNTTTCTRTAEIGIYNPHNTVWWKVDLGRVYSIYSINILFKNYDGYGYRQRGRFAGFSVYVSTTGDIQGSSLCYKDGSQLPPLNFTTTCTERGRFIIFYNERLDGVTYPDGYVIQNVFTELCEVIVQGCNKSGVYGENCNIPCPINCKDSICNIQNRSCIGCKSGWTGQTCSTKCIEGWYGVNCSQQCKGHCRGGATCNHVTGLCQRGCADGWTGSMCEKDDLAYRKIATQSQTYPGGYMYYDANNAVDGNTTTCTKTTEVGIFNPHNSVWWKVDLGRVYSIYSINIRFKNYDGYGYRQRGRFAGFSLYVSTTGDIQGSTLCYKDGPQLPPLNFTTTCTGQGRYVIFYNDRLDGVTYPDGYEIQNVFTELCEVIVQGCNKSGVYGENCNIPCPINCKDSICNIQNRSCIGCKSGWTGQTCSTKCIEGWYGVNCSLQCKGHCRGGTTCNHVTGLCERGCADGWTGSMCEKGIHGD